jgi:hypothetical protein
MKPPTSQVGVNLQELGLAGVSAGNNGNYTVTGKRPCAAVVGLDHDAAAALTPSATTGNHLLRRVQRGGVLSLGPMNGNVTLTVTNIRYCVGRPRSAPPFAPTRRLVEWPRHQSRPLGWFG